MCFIVLLYMQCYVCNSSSIDNNEWQNCKVCGLNQQVLPSSIFTRRGSGNTGMTSRHSVYQLRFDPGIPTLRSSNTTVRAVSFQFNLSSECFCFPVQTAIVPVYRRQAARSAANMFGRLARSALLYHISLDYLVIEF